MELRRERGSHPGDTVLRVTREERIKENRKCRVIRLLESFLIWPPEGPWDKVFLGVVGLTQRKGGGPEEDAERFCRKNPIKHEPEKSNFF